MKIGDSEDKIRDYYDIEGKGYEKCWSSAAKQDISAFELAFVSRALADLGGARPLKVLELGFGTGRIAREILKQPNIEYYGLDISPVMLRHFQVQFLDNKQVKRVACFDFRQGTPFGGEKFDAIVASRTLYYNQNWREIIRKLAELLNNDGILIFSYLNKFSSAILGKIMEQGSLHGYYASRRQIGEALRQGGLSIKEITGYARALDVVYDWCRSRGAAALLRGVESVLRGLLGSLLFARMFYIVAQKKEVKDLAYLFLYGDQHAGGALNPHQQGKGFFDGGSNIHTNFLLRTQAQWNASIFTYADNYQVRNFFGKLPNVKTKEFQTLSSLFKKNLLMLDCLGRCVYPGLRFLFKKIFADYLITQTDFLPDTFSAWLAKMRNPQLTWVASFFLKAPTPWAKDSPYRGKRWLIGLGYWLFQLPSLGLIKWKADKVLLTSAPDIKRFLSAKRDLSKIFVVQGGVNLEEIDKYIAENPLMPLESRKYDACFLGRFHYQKGVLELIDIWQIICLKKPGARLLLMGDGILRGEIEKRIRQYGLEKNIELLGFKSGREKFPYFRNSKIVVHPATYDSGGMAAAEGLAFGLPGVAFDLESLKTYYPKGMLKAPLNNLTVFADDIQCLLEDKNLYIKIATDARELAATVWDWENRARKMKDFILT